MTCIIGIVKTLEDGTKRIVMGGDSAATSSQDQVILHDDKVFTNGPYIMGHTWTYRMGQLLRYAFTPPIPNENEDVKAFLCTKFIHELKKCFAENGWLQKEKEQESGGIFLLGYKDRLFKIQPDFSVLESVDEYAACGSGENIALGSLYSTKDKPLNKRIILALEASERYCCSVRRPFKIVENLLK